MKTCYLLIFLLLINLFVNAQKIEWAKKLGDHYIISFYEGRKPFLELDDMNKIWLFYSAISDSLGQHSYNLLKKFDQSGILLSTDTLPSLLRLFDIHRSDHSTYFIAGASYDSTINLSGYSTFGYFIAEMNYSNSWQNITNSNSDFNQRTQSIVGSIHYKFDDNGNCFISAEFDDTPHNRCIFLKYDKKGNSICHHLSERLGVTTQTLSNGNWYGYQWTNDPINYLNLFDSSCNLISIFPFPQSAFDMQIVADNSDNVYLSGNYNNKVQIGSFPLSVYNNVNNFLLVKMDTNKIFTWAKSINSTGRISFLKNEAINIDPINNRIYISGNYTDSLISNNKVMGSYDYGTGHSSLFLAAYDFDGTEKWIVSWPSSNTVMPLKLSINQKGDVYLFGSYTDSLFLSPVLTSSSSGDYFLMKIKDESIIKTDSAIDNSLLIFPNPASKNISIHYNLCPGNNGQLTIFNILGKKMINSYLPTGSKNIEVDIMTWSKGVYICTIETDGKFFNGKIVKN